MKFRTKVKRAPTIKDKKFLLYIVFFAVSYLVFSIAAILNGAFNDLTSKYSIIIRGLDIPRLGVIIAPIVEEVIKFLGYAIIFLFPLKISKSLGYKNKSEFVSDYLPIAFLFSVGLFGVYEGVYKNINFSSFCILSFVILQSLTHITYSIYPLILGRKYNNWFVCFLPIAILLHAVHNFMIEVVRDNKWVTFTMVTIFLQFHK